MWINSQNYCEDYCEMTNKNLLQKHLCRGRIEWSFSAIMKQVLRSWGVILGFLFAVANVPPSVAKIEYEDLSLRGSGTGSGRVEGASLDCRITAGSHSGTCVTNDFPTDYVTLTATADSGHTFTGWTGETCSDTGQCTFSMDSVKTVTAQFQKQATAATTCTETTTGSTVCKNEEAKGWTHKLYRGYYGCCAECKKIEEGDKLGSGGREIGSRADHHGFRDLSKNTPSTSAS